VVVAIVVTALIWALTTPTTHEGGWDADGRHYAAMAGVEGFSSHIGKVGPWCYRVLTPAIVELLPVEPMVGFTLVTFVANVANLVLLDLLLLAAGISGHRARLLALGLWATSFWTLRFSFFSPAYIDAPTTTVLLAGLVLALRHRWLPSLLVFTLGVLQKESLAAFALAPAVMVWQDHQLGRFHRRLVALGFGVAPLAVAWGIREAIDAPGFSTWTVVDGELRALASAAGMLDLTAAAFAGLGLLPAVVLIGWRSVLGLGRRHEGLAVAAVVAASTVVGGVDKSRPFLYLLPLVLLVAADLVERWKTPHRGLWLWCTTCVVGQAALAGLFEPTPSFELFLTRFVPEHADFAAHRPFLVAAVALNVVVVVTGLGIRGRRDEGTEGPRD
jgi:hypothetical protein